MTIAADILTQTRLLGRTGFAATRIGIGDLADRSLSLETCVATLRRALDAGLNLVDTAPGYEDGFSEQIVGAALQKTGLRDKIFLIDKIDHHNQPVAAQLDGSLRALATSHVDLLVLHGLSTLEGFEKASAPNAAFDQLDTAKKAGKTRFRGISSHHPDVLAKAITANLCDVVLFPIGPYVDDRYRTQILPLARKHNVGTVCFKTFGAGKLLGDNIGYNRPLANRPRGKLSSGGEEQAAPTLPYLTGEECLHYTLTCDPDVALLGMSFPNEQDAAFAAARSFAGPLDDSKMADLRRRAIDAIRGKGPCWWNPNPTEPA